MLSVLTMTYPALCLHTAVSTVFRKEFPVRHILQLVLTVKNVSACIFLLHYAIKLVSP